MVEIINRGHVNCPADPIITDTGDGRLHITCPSCPLEWYTKKD